MQLLSFVKSETDNVYQLTSIKSTSIKYLTSFFLLWKCRQERIIVSSIASTLWWYKNLGSVQSDKRRDLMWNCNR